MSVKANAKKIKDFALVPVGGRPNGDKRGDDGILAWDPNAQPHCLAQGNRKEMVIQFETRLHREAVYRGNIREKIELQSALGLQVFGGAPKMFRVQDNGEFAAKLGGFNDRLLVPGAQFLDNRILFYGFVRHFWGFRWVVEGFQSRAPFFHR